MLVHPAPRTTMRWRTGSSLWSTILVRPVTIKERRPWQNADPKPCSPFSLFLFYRFVDRPKHCSLSSRPGVDSNFEATALLVFARLVPVHSVTAFGSSQFLERVHFCLYIDFFRLSANMVAATKSRVAIIALYILSIASDASARQRWLERDGRSVQLYPRRFGQEHPAVIDKLSSACPGQVCGTLAGQAITPLLAAQGECTQQDLADSIIGRSCERETFNIILTPVSRCRTTI